MTTKTKWMIATLMLSSGHLLANAFPPQAFVQAEERGQALLFTRLNNCYGVTPAHVMGSDFFASLMGTGKNRPVGDADFLQKFGYDLSILYVSGSLSQHCGNNITDIPNLDDLLNGATRAVVSSVNDGGELTRQTQTVIDKGLIYFRVRPESPSDRLYQGMSGSLVIVNEQAAGILQSVDAETGEGKVLRLDRALETVRPFFRSNDNNTETIPISVAQPTISSKIEVIEWSEPPSSAEHRASLLVDKNEGYWRAGAKFPQSISLKTIGDELVSMTSIELHADSISAKEELVKDVEILGSLDGERWNSIGSGTFVKSRASLTIRFSPVKYRFFRVKVYSNWGGAYVSIGSISLGRGEML